MIDEIWAARRRIAEATRRTPLVPLEGAGGKGAVWLKLENLQRGGSYKIRGLYNRIARVAGDVAARGAKTVSAGNAAIAAALACREIGASLEVLMPEGASELKIAAVRSLGGTVVQRPSRDIMEYLAAEGWREESRFFVHPFDHPDVWAGHGTCGLEVLEQLPGVKAVVVPIGGGGLVSGVAAAVKELAPDVKVVGAQAAAVAPWVEAVRRGEPYRVENPGTTIADGINVNSVFPGTWAAAGKLIDGCVAVTEDEIRQAIRLLAAGNRVVAEGAGAVSLAAALGRELAGLPQPVVAIVSGGNLDPALLAGILAAG